MLCEVNYAERANMQNVKFPGLTFIILATSELEQLYTLKCQSALQNVKLIVNTNSICCRLGVSAQMSGAKMMGGGVTGGGAGGGGLMATITSVFSKVLGANSGEMRKQCMNLQI